MLKQIKQYRNFSLFYVVLALINGLFVFKYGLRVKPFSYIILTYIGLVCVQLTLLIFCFKIKPHKKFSNSIYWIVSILFFIITILINNYVDGQSLNVDRWSAMHVGIQALLNGEYPYTAIDHLGGRTSNLPSLLLLGIPFYFLGDVGYLQSFTFLLFSVLIHRLFKNKAIGFGVLLLLLTSPSYLYEIYVKSDLVSNFILVLLFIILSFRSLERKTQKYPFLWGLLSSLIFYTRLTAVIPILLIFFKKFFSWDSRTKIWYLLGGLFMLALLTVIVFVNYPSIEVLMKKNPFVLQNRQLPFLLSIVFIILPCFFSFKIQTVHELLFYCVLLLALPVFTSLCLYMVQFGIWEAIKDSRFDLSYLNILTPFLLVYLGYSLQSKPTSQ